MIWFLPLCLAAELTAVDYFKQASTQLKNGHEQQAVGTLQKALQADPQFEPALYNLANTYLRLGQAQQAIQTAKECTSERCQLVVSNAEEYLTTIPYLDTFDKDHYDRDEIDCAQFQRVLELAPKSKPVLSMRAQCYLARGSVIEAVKDITRISQIDLHDQDSAARAAIGNFILMNQRKPAFALLRKCVQFDDNAVKCKTAHKQLRQLEKMLKKPKLKELSKVIDGLRSEYSLNSKGEEDSGGALIETIRAQRCTSLAMHERWEQAARVCAQVRDVDPDFPAAVLVDAHLEFNQGHLRQAQDAISKLMKEANNIEYKLVELAEQLSMLIRVKIQEQQQHFFHQQQRRHGGGPQQFSDKDYYKILGVDEKASQKEIRRAYRQLSKKYHPDKVKKNGGSVDEGMAKMQELNEAYEVLNNEDRRSEYDIQRGGHIEGGGAQLFPGGPGHPFGAGADMFGGGAFQQFFQ